MNDVIATEKVKSSTVRQRKLPFVSIVVPAHNAEKTLARCLDALLEQSHPDFEIIAVDNNSTDRTGEIILEYARKDERVKYVHEPEVACTKARVRGFQACTADFIAMIDSDCFATKDWLKNHLQALLSEDDVGSVAGRTKVEPGKTLVEKYYSSQDPFNFEKFLDNEWVPWGQGNNSYRKEVFDLVGYYDTRFRWGAGREFHKRMMEKTKYRVKYAPEAVIYHAPRGSLKELFKVGAKYSNSTIIRAKILRNRLLLEENRFLILRKFVKLSVCCASIVYGIVKFAIGKASVERLVFPCFFFVQLVGGIYGSVLARVFSKQVR